MTIKFLNPIYSNSMNEDIVFVVLHHSTFMAQYDERRWKENLKLLSVSRSMRYMAMPMVYNTVSVCCSSLKACIATNADMFVKTNNMALARCLDLKFDNVNCAYTELDRANQALKSYAKCWTNIKTIKICITYADSSSELASPIEPDQLDAVINNLCVLIPNAEKLIFGKTNNILAQELYGNLAESYATQAKHIKTYQPVMIAPTMTFTKLTCLNIQLNRQNCQLPAIYADSLECLAMKDIPLDFTWSTFKSANKNIKVFPQLKTLQLTFNVLGKTANTQSVQRLQFPSLENLKIQNIAGFCQLIEQCQFPKTICNVQLVGSVKAIDLLHRVKLPATDRLTLSTICMNYNDELDFFSAVNQLKWKGNRHTSADIFMHGSMVIKVPSVVECASLEKLVISAPIDISNLLLIVQRLPNISVLTILRLVTKHAQLLDTISESKASKSSQTVPYNSKLKKLTFGFRSSEISENCVVALIQNLAIRLRLLEKFDVPQVPCTPVIEFTEKYTAEYPHLANIRFTLK